MKNEIQAGTKRTAADNSTSASLEQNGMLSAVYLFLDDIREPEHAFEYTKQEMFIKQKWEVVRNFDEFKSFIENNGLPTFISFDHDLADTHYTPEPLWTDYEKSKEWQDKQIHQEKTGYECAKWLVEYCIGNKLKCPGYYCPVNEQMLSICTFAPRSRKPNVGGSCRAIKETHFLNYKKLLK